MTGPAVRHLNELDERTVHVLAEDARRSYADIGAVVGLSAPAVKRRVDGCERRARSPASPYGWTPAALGWETEGYIRALSRYPEVASASTVTGDADAIVQIFASDMRHFERVLERIAGSRGRPSDRRCTCRTSKD